MSKILLYTIMVVVPDDDLVNYPDAISTKHGYLSDIVESSVEEVDLDWLKQVRERVDGD